MKKKKTFVFSPVRFLARSLLLRARNSHHRSLPPPRDHRSFSSTLLNKCVVCIHYSRKTVNNKRKGSQTKRFFFFFFFAEAERPNFCESEREQERKEADFF